ncbi:hypothetical protein FB451DRAFT_1296114, partial [Mycena latifolia]
MQRVVFLALMFAVLGALAVPVPESLSSTSVSVTEVSQTYHPSSRVSVPALPTTTPPHTSQCHMPFGCPNCSCPGIRI